MPVWPAPELARYDDISTSELLRQAGASEGLIELFDAGFGLLDRYSGLETLAQAAGGLFDPLVRIVGGAARLPRAMADKLGSHILYGTPVTRIEHCTPACARRASLLSPRPHEPPQKANFQQNPVGLPASWPWVSQISPITG